MNTVFSLGAGVDFYCMTPLSKVKTFKLSQTAVFLIHILKKSKPAECFFSSLFHVKYSVWCT